MVQTHAHALDYTHANDHTYDHAHAAQNLPTLLFSKSQDNIVLPSIRMQFR